MAQLLVAVWSEADQVQELRHARAQSCSGHSVEPAVQPEKLGGREPVVKAEVLGQEADLAAGLDVSYRMAEEQGVPGGRRHEAQQHLY